MRHRIDKIKIGSKIQEISRLTHVAVPPTLLTTTTPAKVEDTDDGYAIAGYKNSLGNCTVRYGMDLALIFGGGFVCLAFASMILSLVPINSLQLELRLLIAVASTVFGMAGGYILTWSIKKSDQLAEQQARKYRASKTPQKPQIVGSKCAVCEASIMFVMDAHVCPTCNLVKCKNCEPVVPCSLCTNPIIQAELVD